MILIIGGTSDTHDFVKTLNTDKYIITVATEYGFQHFTKLYPDKIKYIRFTLNTLLNFIEEYSITKIVDTAHPFAMEITKIAKEGAGLKKIKYLNAKRDLHIPNFERYLEYEKLKIVHSWKEADEYLEMLDKLSKQRVFFTIGTNNLYHFPNSLENAIVRVLDDPKSINICKELNLKDEQIIAKRGPFSIDENIEVIEANRVDILVTKDSGIKGGIVEKLSAAIQKNIDILIVSLPNTKSLNKG